MAGMNSLDAVKRKIQCLQQQADEAEDRAESLQKELDNERELREKVRFFFFHFSPLSQCFFLSFFFPGPRASTARRASVRVKEVVSFSVIDSPAGVIVPQDKALIKKWNIFFFYVCASKHHVTIKGHQKLVLCENDIYCLSYHAAHTKASS
uniref:Uncharacterized protein n=1 Tax=Oryzias latipes TaxID=8090 RepID=A0A3P9MBP6_ORYLA